MHCVGFVFVKEPTKKAVAEALEDHKDTHWDWYRCGGRWDGYFGGEAEMKARETSNGFNFDKGNDNAERNACRVKDIPTDMRPYFFVSDFRFVPQDHYDEYQPSEHGPGYGAIVETPDWETRYQAALVKHADEWAVVVDVHN